MGNKLNRKTVFVDLNGNWLTIKSTDAKSHRTRDIELNEVTKGIVQEMRDRYHYYMDEYGQKPRNVIMNYGKQFKKACDYPGIKGKTYLNLVSIISHLILI